MRYNLLKKKGGKSVERENALQVLFMKKDKELLSEKEEKIIELIRSIGYGEIKIIVQAGEPVRVEEIKKSFKLWSAWLIGRRQSGGSSKFTNSPQQKQWFDHNEIKVESFLNHNNLEGLELIFDWKVFQTCINKNSHSIAKVKHIKTARVLL